MSNQRKLWSKQNSNESDTKENEEKLRKMYLENVKKSNEILNKNLQNALPKDFEEEER